eukprot:1179758-Prorocentrum_minimum.AAC.5
MCGQSSAKELGGPIRTAEENQPCRFDQGRSHMGRRWPGLCMKAHRGSRRNRIHTTGVGALLDTCQSRSHLIVSFCHVGGVAHHVPHHVKFRSAGGERSMHFSRDRQRAAEKNRQAPFAHHSNRAPQCGYGVAKRPVLALRRVGIRKAPVSASPKKRQATTFCRKRVGARYVFKSTFCCVVTDYTRVSKAKDNQQQSAIGESAFGRETDSDESPTLYMASCCRICDAARDSTNNQSCRSVRTCHPGIQTTKTDRT